MEYILYNEKSRNGSSKKQIEKVEKLLSNKNYTKVNVIGLDYDDFLGKLSEDDTCILMGGDGTLMHFVNLVDGKTLPCPFYFFSAGTGNDFSNDMKDYIYNDKIFLNECIKNLPKVTVKGKTYRFINGIGYGIDGYCCEEADRIQAKSSKPISYTTIALKGILFKYRCPNAMVSVDGGEWKRYTKVLLAPTMKGRFYGGGMMITPFQNRFDKERYVTFAIAHDASKLRIIWLFLKIFKGKHTHATDIFTMTKCRNVKVRFDTPCALQIDGETILNVSEYEVNID